MTGVTPAWNTAQEQSHFKSNKARVNAKSAEYQHCSNTGNITAQPITSSTYSFSLYIFSEKNTSSRSLWMLRLSAASRTPSFARIPKQVPACPMASIAYSTWYKRPRKGFQWVTPKVTLNETKYAKWLQFARVWSMLIARPGLFSPVCYQLIVTEVVEKEDKSEKENQQIW